MKATRKVREREEMIRADALANRERVVEWRLSQRRIESSVQTLSEASARLERLSLEDPLTGIANRRQFELQLASMLEDSRQSTVPTSIAFIDVDRFKQINDTHSHDVGDQVLQAIARVLSESLREQDLPARLAGDEVMVIGNRKGGTTKERVRRNFGMPHPEGYRKALRCMSFWPMRPIQPGVKASRNRSCYRFSLKE